MKTPCPHCGRNMTPYKVPLTVGVLKGLIKFYHAVYHHNRNKIHLLDDMSGTPFELSRHEWNNFTRLRFHGLVAKYKENGEHVSGYWLLTRRGKEFLLENLDIPRYVWIFNNRIIERSGERVTMEDVYKNKDLPYLETITDIKYEEPKFNEEGQGELL